MAIYNLNLSLLLLKIFFILSLVGVNIIGSGGSMAEDKKIYIVYMGGLPSETEYSPTSHHESILQEVLDDSLVKDVLIHSYKRSFNGFAAKLTEREIQKLHGREDFVSMFPARNIELHTTRSWDFLGFSETVERVLAAESDIIVGVLDSGIWPESESFNDDGFGPPPNKWKGVCKGGKNFTCNNKLIGARYYSEEDNARDTVGHGTHTASTAAGNKVNDVSFFDIAKGNARGAVPSARIAVYKVCGESGCSDADILAGFDDAIADGVDILSVSLGALVHRDLDQDPIAIGAFHAMQNGILTSNSAGNSGNGILFFRTTSNAPWLFTVGATTTDRKIINKIVLGNGKKLEGRSVNSFELNGKRFPILYGENVSKNCSIELARACSDNCLDKDLVKDKIVICERRPRWEEALEKNVLGTILIFDSEDSDVASIYPLPATHLNTTVGKYVKAYFNSTKIPLGTILKSESVKDSEAPLVASFSSPGPNDILPDIIKPDISAPGIDILAAFSPKANPSRVSGDKRSVKYSVLSGTSMSCPHATGAAAYVKSFHPDWSPSAIKSALMTTAFPMNGNKNKGVFDFGAGNIDPVKAVNPGLVYDILTNDYITMLCDIGYSSSKVKLITNHTCSENRVANRTARDLNYPSFGAKVQDGESIKIKFPRTVTNVGRGNSTYKAKIISDDRIKVVVEPSVLSFESVNEKKSFVLNVEVDTLQKDETATAILHWSDGIHSVRSPIVVYTSQR